MIPGFINVVRGDSRPRPKADQTRLHRAREFANLLCERLNKIRPAVLPLPLDGSVFQKAEEISEELKRSFELLAAIEDLPTFVRVTLEISHLLEEEGVLLKIMHTPGGFVLLTGEISALHDSGEVRVIESLDHSKNLPPEAFSLFLANSDFTPELMLLRPAHTEFGAYYGDIQGERFSYVANHFPDMNETRLFQIRDAVLNAPSDELALSRARGYEGREYQLGVVFFFFRKALKPFRKLEKEGFSEAVDKAYLFNLVVHELHHLLEKIRFHTFGHMHDYLFGEAGRASREFTAVLASKVTSPFLMFSMFELVGVAANPYQELCGTSPQQVAAMRRIFDIMHGIFGSVDDLMVADPAEIMLWSRVMLSNFYKTSFGLHFNYDETFGTNQSAIEVIHALRL